MLTNRVQRTRFLGIETKFFELGLQASFTPPIAHQTHSKISYTFQKYTVTLNSLSLSVSLSLSDSPLSLNFSLTLTLLLRLHRRRCCHRHRFVSALLSVSPSAKLLSSLLKLLDEEEALAVGVAAKDHVLSASPELNTFLAFLNTVCAFSLFFFFFLIYFIFHLMVFESHEMKNMSSL